jgi:branched-chain amino acid transport system permease protein
VVIGLVGALWFFFIGQVLPQYGFDPLFDLSVALMAFFGGFGTLWGPILGALILEPGQQYLTLKVSNSYASELIWGSLFLLVILFLPRGVVPMVGEKAMAWRARRERRRAGQPAPARPAAADTADTADPALPGPAGARTPGGRSAR